MSNKRSLGALPLLYPQPAILIGTYDANGKANVMTAAWGGICSSDPLSLSVSIRPVRFTYDAIMSRKAFTVCVPSEDLAAQVDYAGMVSGRREDKAIKAALTMVRAEKIDAPYVEECPLIIECSLSQTLDIGVHTMMIGTIEDVKVNADCLGGNDMPVMEKLKPLLFDSGSRSYYGVGKCIAQAFSAGKAFLKGEES